MHTFPEEFPVASEGNGDLAAIKKCAFLIRERGISRFLVGNKGAGLAQLHSLGVPVPPGFTLATTVARTLDETGHVPVSMLHEVIWGINALERATGKSFGDDRNPLLLSVRSGAVVSMPGMMDTVLNLGMNPSIAEGLAKAGGERFGWDCYRRFLSMYGEIVLGVPRRKFDEILTNVKKNSAARNDADLTGQELRSVCEMFDRCIEQETGSSVDRDPWVQLRRAINAVLNSWNSARAKAYRATNGIPDSLGTAVNIQSMVYGNLDVRSGTGVVFSRNCSTGKPGLWGEFLVNAQGEDVVSGSHTPVPIAEMKIWNREIYDQLDKIVNMLESTRKEVVDVEFTVSAGKLYVLQVRKANLAPEAAVTVAVNFVWENKITQSEALKMVTKQQVDTIKRNFNFNPGPIKLPTTSSKSFFQRMRDFISKHTSHLLQFFKKEQNPVTAPKLIAKGIPASPGVVSGIVVCDSASALAAARRGETVVLVRPDTSPNDLEGMMAAAAIVTSTGGATSHAAVVARGLNKPAVVGVENLVITAGALITVDGMEGVIYKGEVRGTQAESTVEMTTFVQWLQLDHDNALPKPCLNFKLCDEQVSVSQIINDFYLVDAMAQNAPLHLQHEMQQLKLEVHHAVSVRLATYLTVAVSGELRYAQRIGSRGNSEMDELEKKFKFKFTSGSRSRTQTILIGKLSEMTGKDHARFLQLATTVFEKPGWGSSFGGKKWANIAKAALRYLNGTLPDSIFADHTFDLQHNGGRVFGKHPMLSCTEWLVSSQLEKKKWAPGARELHDRLLALWRVSRDSFKQAEAHSSFLSKKVRDLYTLGFQQCDQQTGQQTSGKLIA